jgi:hypothetical protein
MTKEDIFRTFLNDPLITEKKYLTPEQASKLKFIEQTDVKLLEVIKIAIDGNIDSDSESVITRRISQYLNK